MKHSRPWKSMKSRDKVWHEAKELCFGSRGLDFAARISWKKLFFVFFLFFCVFLLTMQWYGWDFSHLRLWNNCHTMGAFFLQFMVFLFGNNFELYMLKIFTKYHGTSCKVSISFSLSYTKAYEIGWKGNSFKILKKSEIELSHCHRTNSPVLWMEGTVFVLQFQVRIGGFVRRQNHVPGNAWYVYGPW